MNDYEFSYDDFDSMLNDAAFDYNSVNDIDLSSLGDAVDYSQIFDQQGLGDALGEGLDFSGDFKIDPSAFSFDDIDSMLSDAALGSGGFNLADVLGEDFDYNKLLEQQGLGDALSSSQDGGFKTRSFTPALKLDEASQAQQDSGQERSIYSLLPDRSTNIAGLTRTGQDQFGMIDESGAGLRYTLPTSRNYRGDLDYEAFSRLPKDERYAMAQQTPDAGEPNFKTKGDISPGLTLMNGAQGLTTYVPKQEVEYEKVLENLVESNPDKFSLLEKYIKDLEAKGPDYVTNTGGTIGAAGFTPSGSSYAIGDPRSFINNPNVTGEPGVVSRNQTAIRSPNDQSAKVFGTKPSVNYASGHTPQIPGEKTLWERLTNTGPNVGSGGKDDTKKPFNLGGGGGGSGKDDNSLLMLLMMMMMMNQNKGGGGSSAVIPGLTASQKQTPYAQQQKSAGYRPGQGGVTYFEPTQYSPNMAAGGGISRLLRGPGDGVSDSIPAVISNGMAKGGQPAKLARGEYVIDARTVAALGNGSTDAGAERLDKMRKDILRDDRRAGVGKDSKAYRHLLA
jgi:hypothetical protein